MSNWLPTSTVPPPSMAYVAVPILTPLGAHPWAVPPLFFATPPIAALPVFTTAMATVAPPPVQQPMPLPSAPATSSPITLESLAAAVQDVTRSLATMQSNLAIWQPPPPPPSTATIAAAPTTGAIALPGGPSLQHPFTDGIFYRGTGVQQLRMSAAVRLQAVARGLLARRRVRRLCDLQLIEPRTPAQFLQVVCRLAKSDTTTALQPMLERQTSAVVRLQAAARGLLACRRVRRLCDVVRCIGDLQHAISPTAAVHAVVSANGELHLYGNGDRGGTPFLVTKKARIEAQVKAAEAAAQRKFDEEMRMKREQEREAARLALRMMKKTVDIDNSDFLKELENFSKTWQSNPPGKIIVDFIGGDLPPGLGSPLERLGLFMKNDFEDEVEQEMEDSASPSMDVDMRKDFQEDAGHEMQDSISPVTVIDMKNDFQGAVGHEMMDSVSPSVVIDTKKDSEEETEHEMVDSVSPLMDVDTEEGEISC